MFFVDALFLCSSFLYFCSASFNQRILHENRWPTTPRKNCQWSNVSFLRSSLIQYLYSSFLLFLADWLASARFTTPRPPLSSTRYNSIGYVLLERRSSKRYLNAQQCTEIPEGGVVGVASSASNVESCDATHGYSNMTRGNERQGTIGVLRSAR